LQKVPCMLQFDIIKLLSYFVIATNVYFWHINFYLRCFLRVRISEIFVAN